MDGFRQYRPDLRAPGGGRHLHLDRLIFLRKIQEHIPECLRDLYQTATSGEDEDNALSVWSTRWNLVDEWINEVARRTYRVYAEPGKHRQKRERYLQIYDWNQELIEAGEVSMRPPPFGRKDLEPPYEFLRWYGLGTSLSDLSYASIREFSFLRRPADPFIFTASYDPEIDSRAEIRERLIEEWESFADAREAQARDEGAEEPVRKRGRTGDATLHFAWAARWQVGKESATEIGENPGEGVSTTRHPKTVREAVKNVCERIDLTRRTKLDTPD